MKSHLTQRRLALIALAILAISALIGLMIQPYAARAARTDPVSAAWDAARAAGSYHFTSDVTQVTLPTASIANVGRSSRTEKLYLAGQNDLAAERMELTLWSEGGSTLDAASGISIRSEQGKTFARRGGRSASSAEPWQEIDDFTGAIAPQGDFMSYLAAIQDVTAQPAENRNGIDLTRYTFTIDSPRFALTMHKQMEAALRARGELPPSLQLDVPGYFRDMLGSGEMWVGHDGLP